MKIARHKLIDFRRTKLDVEVNENIGAKLASIMITPIHQIVNSSCSYEIRIEAIDKIKKTYL